MSPGIQLRWTLSRDMLPESDEQQLMYVLLEAAPQGLPTSLPKLPLNLCLVIDRSSSMRGDRLMQVKDAAQRIVDLQVNLWPIERTAASIHLIGQPDAL